MGTATGSITISWLAPVEETDGSPLTDLTGYKIYWGMSLGDYPNSVTLNHPGVVTYVIENLTPGTYYLVATAFDSDGVESEHSEVVSRGFCRPAHQVGNWLTTDGQSRRRLEMVQGAHQCSHPLWLRRSQQVSV